MAKRSPILGYNHNVRYRGLVFHVQTEDSGVLSPHLFTHLFHEGVIISTRKLVYDGGASEDAIKALMQAQHKAVLKDLKIHTFDDKIDAYLGNVEGLEPREKSPIAARVSEPEITIEPATERAGTDPELAPADQTEQIEIIKAEPPKKPPTAEQAAVTAELVDQVSKPRTQTAERTSKGSQFRSIPPPEVQAQPELLEMPDTTVPTQMPVRPTPPPPPNRANPRAATPPPIPRGASKSAITVDSSPEIEIINHESDRHRSARDTAVDNTFEDNGVPQMVGPDATIPSDGIPPRPNTASRPPGQAAAMMPALRQPSRPAITPPSVVSRPLPPDPNRNRGDSEAIEIYAPAPPSVEAPPGERTERPGQYSMNRRAGIQSQENVPLRDHTGRVAIPAGLARPRPPQPPAPNAPRTAAPSSPPIPTPPSGRASSSQSDGVVRNPTQPPPSDGVPQQDPRTSTPQRTPHLTAPISSRTATGGSTASGNVITTRPAVIVGAPPKVGNQTAPQRVRKAREDEGRGFGQGLISEKSLDEVILAYLSEDADEK